MSTSDLLTAENVALLLQIGLKYSERRARRKQVANDGVNVRDALRELEIEDWPEPPPEE